MRTPTKKRPGRPRIVDRPGFLSQWAEVYPQIVAGQMSHGEAARRLGCGFATVVHLLRSATREEGRP